MDGLHDRFGLEPDGLGFRQLILAREHRLEVLEDRLLGVTLLSAKFWFEMVAVRGFEPRFRG
jgi:hypothetical protein